MAYEMRENSGSLFKNDRREKETHAHAKGQALIGGVEYWVSAWTKESRDGTKFQSLAFTPKNADQTGSYGNQEPARGGGVPRGQFDQDLDDVPFATCDPSLEWRVS